jgi:RNA recognition motif-containing protein
MKRVREEGGKEEGPGKDDSAVKGSESPQEQEATTTVEATGAPAQKRPHVESPHPSQQKHRLEGQPSAKLYVGNLPKTATEANIIQLFSPYGKIQRLQFFWHKEGPKRVSFGGNYFCPRLPHWPPRLGLPHM